MEGHFSLGLYFQFEPSLGQRHRLRATRTIRTPRSGPVDGPSPPSVTPPTDGVGPGLRVEPSVLKRVTEAPLAVGAAVEVDLVGVAVVSAPVSPTAAPSLGDSWSDTSPLDDVNHWHWKSFFHNSAGSGSMGLESESGGSVALATSA